MKKRIVIKIKPLSKAEVVYLKKLKDRPSDTIFREIESKMSIYNNSPSSTVQLPGT
jgi:hypothetical protein